MTKLKPIFTLIFLLVTLCSFAQDLPERPNPPRLVNDYTNTLTPEQKAILERKLVAFNDSSSTQIAVVIIPSLNGYDISDYAFKLGDKWGIGQKDKRNGVLLLTSMKDRKVFIAVGYGLEGAIPDAYAKRITSTIIKPSYQAGNYYKGIEDGTDALIKLASGEYQADPSHSKGIGVFPVFLIIFLVFIVISFISRRSQYQHIAGRGAGSDLPFWMLMTMLGNRGHRNRGNWDDFTGGGGGFGGGDSGGFGGFGGGSFGGGGAGDSW
ncbi:TPM domain-containing protein [Solitalea koreensis]|uniref:TPM domain-containing protein n=1 Tax=Solitalea koreensis TaxID=543615 RepID=A0A521CSJ0_9SPHI|nr:TPM domain-containing protein [Solitalea koreensis]SMO62345.1 uncharacterized protein SAMN06265350_104324 [Solitalea koreensis]